MSEEFDIGWSNRTSKDLEKIERYLKENASDLVAEKVIRALFNAVEPTRTQPERFPLEPKLKKYGNYRFIMIWNYRIIYEFTGNQIIVHRIVHGRQDRRKWLRSIK